MTHARSRLRIARAATVGAAAGALALGLMTVPAQATAGPFVAFLDVAHNRQLSIGDPTGAGPAAVAAGLRGQSFDVSADGVTVALVARTGVEATPAFDTTEGLLVSNGVTTHVVATWVDSNPVVSASGADVWFASYGDLYRADPATGVVTRLTTNAPLTPMVNGELAAISVAPDGLHVAAVFTRRASQNLPINASTVSVYPMTTATPAAQWTATFPGPTGPEALPDQPAWLDAGNLLYGVCATGACASWTWSKVDVTSPSNTGVAVPLLADHYGLRKLDTTWYSWIDSGAGPSAVTSLQTSTDDFTSLSLATARTDGTTTTSYIPTNGVPSAISAATSLGRPGAQAHLDLSTALVKTGGRSVYDSYALFLKAVGDQTLGLDFDEVDRGLLTYSIDGGHTWKPLRTTSSATSVPWPGGGAPGNGLTQALTRNTWFRWAILGDAFVAPAASPVRLVRVKPTITHKVTKSGTKRIVSGKAARIGGSAVLYKGTKKIATVHMSATGAYSFGKRTLSRGTYRVLTLADASWAAGAVSFSI